MTTIPDTLDALRVPIDSVQPYARNPRRGRVDVVARSLERHGQYRPIVVNARSHEVLAGNHTLLAARELGWDEIAATFVDVDDDAAARIVLVDNRASDVAGYDDDELVALLGELDTLDGTGYDVPDLEALLGSLGHSPNGADGPDTSPQLGAIEYRLIVTCDDEHHQARWLERLQGDGLKVQAIAQ
jgi:ParB-like chromosome segregation protein Spo0J